MKLFIDTSNKKLIIAIINDKSEIVDFLMKDSNNDMVKNTLPEIESFIKKNKLNWDNFNEYLTTIGPGSFTGVKVGLNIIRSINLIKPIGKIYTIDCFKLVTVNKSKYTAIKLGKSKYYLKNNITNRIKVVEELDDKVSKSVTIDYDEFHKETLQEKILNKSFKVLDNIDKVKINYINKF